MAITVYVKDIDGQEKQVASGNPPQTIILPTRKDNLVVIYLDYTKGGETGLQILSEIYEVSGWSLTQGFALSKADSAGLISPDVFEVQQSGRYRIVIPVLLQEDKVAITFRSNGTWSGTATVWLSTGRI